MTAVHIHSESSGPLGSPPIVLLNSLGSTMDVWDLQMEVLRSHFRVIRSDLRGHGLSPVPPGPYSIDDLVDDTVALLDRWQLERAHVVGLSLGGMVALRLAAREPDRVDRLAVMCTSALLGPPEGWAERARLVRAEGTAAVASTVVGRWLTPEHRAADPAFAEQLEAMIASIPAEGYAASCAAIEHMDLRGDLSSITAPTVAIAGAQDPVTSPPHLAAIVEAIPGSRLLVIDDAAHLANLDQPAAVSAALVEHLTGGPRKDSED
jgi:3-oxoadipate enol-lactonase